MRVGLPPIRVHIPTTEQWASGNKVIHSLPSLIVNENQKVRRRRSGRVRMVRLEADNRAGGSEWSDWRQIVGQEG
jgi:hypothetical protein